jgi:hypothetical protein
MKSFLLATAIAVLPLAPAVAFAADPLFDGARLTEHVQILASDGFEGRGPATLGEDKTVAYVAGQFAAVGLEPGGDLKDGKRAWTQDVPLGQFNIDGPIAASVTVAGKTTALVQGEDIAIRAAMTNVDSVSLANTPIVWVGYGVTAPERNWDDFKGIDVKGKIIVLLINDPDFETGKGDFGGKAMTYSGRWTYKSEEAARRGAAHVTAVDHVTWNSPGANGRLSFDIVVEALGIPATAVDIDMDALAAG